MPELMDNSGPYNPNRKFEDFSKEFLLKLLKAYMRAYMLLEAFWGTEVKNTGRFNEDEYVELETKIWTRIANTVQPMIAKLSNIELPVKDVVDAVKIGQILPDNDINPDVFLSKIDIIDNNHAINTLVRCRTLEWLEEHTPELIEPLCQRFEVAAMEAYGRALNPDMTYRPLKLPPRQSRDEIPCQWEFKLEPKK